MAGKAMYDENKPKIMWNGNKIKKGMWAGNIVYSAGNIVTYHVDSGIAYQEEVDEGVTCLQPKTFTPAKNGWTFVGWREDAAANGTVLSSKVMGDSPVTLYAVFLQNVTVTYYNGSATASSTSAYRYYNNNNIRNPSFALTQSAISGWTARGWSTSNAGNAVITYANDTIFTRDSNITLYGMYEQSITLSYAGNGNTGGSTAAQTGTRYWAPAGAINPVFTLQANGFNKTSYKFSKWAFGSASGTQYAAGASVTLSANITMYAIWTYVGAPFFIAEGEVCKKALTWDVVNISNGNNNSTFGITRKWEVGSISNMSTPYSDYTKNSYFTLVSEPIATSGNHNMLIRVETGSSSGNAGCRITINGQTKSAPGGSAGTDMIFDISNVSTITITAYCEAWPYGIPSAGFITVQLY